MALQSTDYFLLMYQADGCGEADLPSSFPQCGESGIQAQASSWLSRTVFTSALKMRKREREAEKERGERDKGKMGREGDGEKMNERKRMNMS